MSRLPGTGDTLDALPLCHFDAGTRWRRISRHDPAAQPWSSSCMGRFNDPLAAFGVLYLAADLVGALAESVCRNAAHHTLRVVAEAEAMRLQLWSVAIDVPLDLLDFSVPNLARFGLDARIFSEYDGRGAVPYAFGPTWAGHARSLGLDGVLYPSRHHTDSVCLALFEHDPAALQVTFVSNVLADEPLKVLDEVFGWGLIGSPYP